MKYGSPYMRLYYTPARCISMVYIFCPDVRKRKLYDKPTVPKVISQPTVESKIFINKRGKPSHNITFTIKSFFNKQRSFLPFFSFLFAIHPNHISFFFLHLFYMISILCICYVNDAILFFIRTF